MYCLLPFRFRAIGDNEILVNEPGNFLIVPRGTARRIAEKKIDEALKLACIYDEIYQKKDKLDTIIKEGGDGLSLGQIQRILLAIALLENRKVLLLDEFTSSLDQETEKKIVNNVIKLPLTKIIITHRAIDIDGAKVLELGNDYE